MVFLEGHFAERSLEARERHQCCLLILKEAGENLKAVNAPEDVYTQEE